jgi:hypothetical protein
VFLLGVRGGDFGSCVCSRGFVAVTGGDDVEEEERGFVKTWRIESIV